MSTTKKDVSATDHDAAEQIIPHVRDEAPGPPGAFDLELKANNLAVLLAKRLPKTVAALSGVSSAIALEAMHELYAALVPTAGGATPEEIDAAYGAGMSELLETEASMADGGVLGVGGIGVLGVGGISAGGIFGEGPVATNLSDPGAVGRISKLGPFLASPTARRLFKK